MTNPYICGLSLFFAKFVGAISCMMWLPLTPIFLNEFNLDLQTYTYLLVYRNFIGFWAICFGSAMDRFPSKLCLDFSLFLLTLSFVPLVFNTPVHWTLLWQHTFGGLGMAFLSSAGQQFISETVPSSQQAQLTAMAEFSWGASTFLGIPTLVWLVESLPPSHGWQAAFALLMVLPVLTVPCLHSIETLPTEADQDQEQEPTPEQEPDAGPETRTQSYTRPMQIRAREPGADRQRYVCEDVEQDQGADAQVCVLDPLLVPYERRTVKDHREWKEEDAHAHAGWSTWLGGYAVICSPRALLLLVALAGVSTGNALFLPVFGLWTEERGLTQAQMGSSTAVLGAGYIFGEAILICVPTTWLQNTHLLAASLQALFYFAFLLDSVDSSVSVGLSLTFFLTFCAEINIVISMSLAPHVPASRHHVGKFTGVFFGLQNVFLACGAYLVPPVWIPFHMFGVALVSGCSCSLCVACLYAFYQQPATCPRADDDGHSYAHMHVSTILEADHVTSKQNSRSSTGAESTTFHTGPGMGWAHVSQRNDATEETPLLQHR